MSTTFALAFLAALGVVNLLLIMLLARRVRSLGGQLQSVRPQPWLKPGARVRDFEATTVDGATFSLDALRGRQTVVGFLSTDCSPCDNLLPKFADYAADHGGPDSVVAVIVGPGSDGDGFVAALTGKATLIREQRRGPVTTAFSTFAFPSIYVIGPDRTVLSSGAALPGSNGSNGSGSSGAGAAARQLAHRSAGGR